MGLFSNIITLVLFFLLAAVVYYGTYNHNMTFFVNLFSLFSHVMTKFLLGEGGEKNKSRFISIRKYMIPPRNKLPHYEGITADVTSVTVRDGTQIDLYTYTPSSIVNEKDPRPHQLVFFCHGGGWVMANRWSNEPVLCKYALQTNSVLTYVNYRLAPEYKHPTAVYDCYDCLKFLLEHKTDFHIDDKQVILMGDSAGGMICFSIAQLARDEVHRNLFKKMVLIYPAMDNRKVPDDDLSWDERNMIYDNTFGLQYKTGEIMSRWYFPSWDSVNSPLGSPIVCEDFTNFPPVRIFTCEYDALKIAAREVAEKMRNAGLDVHYQCIKGAVHAVWGSNLYDCGLNDLVQKELEAFSV